MGGSFHVFTLAGIRVHISLWFLLILFFWMSGDWVRGAVWGAAVTLSILVHEFGHALVAKYFRLSPWVELHGWGGLTYHEHAARDRDDALVIIAGPAAGLLFGAIVFVGQLVLPVEHPLLRHFVSSLLLVNIFWSFVNLAPLWPLDGGQLFRLGMLKLLTPAKAERVTHVVGTAVGLVFCYVAFAVFDERLLLFMAGFVTWMNISRINSTSASGVIRSQNRHAKRLVKEASAAFDAGDWAEATRLAHQAKAETGLDAGTVERIFEILGVSYAAQGQFEDAWSFLSRLKSLRGKIYLAKVEVVLARSLRAEAEPLTHAKAFRDLPEDVQRDLQALAHAPAGS